MRGWGWFTAAATVAAGSVLLWSGDARAVEGCQSVGAFSLTVPANGGANPSGVLKAGDVLTFAVRQGVAGPPDPSINAFVVNAPDGSATPIAFGPWPPAPTATGTYTAPVDGTYTITIALGAGDDLIVETTCSSPAAAAEQAVENLVKSTIAGDVAVAEQRVATALSAPGAGVSVDERGIAGQLTVADDGRFRWGLWGSVHRTSVKTRSGQTRADGDSKGATVGADLVRGDRWVIGAALSMDRSETEFADLVGRVEQDGRGVQLYAGLRLNDWLRASLVGGHGAFDGEFRRVEAGTAISQDVEGRRSYVSGSAAASLRPHEHVRTEASVGALWARIATEAQTDSRGIAHAGTELSYVQGKGSLLAAFPFQADDLGSGVVFEPYLVAGYQHDLSRSGFGPSEGERSGYSYGGGFGLSWPAGISLGLEIERTDAHDQVEFTSVRARANVRF